jgi:hypothetical protein
VITSAKAVAVIGAAIAGDGGSACARAEAARSRAGAGGGKKGENGLRVKLLTH